MSDLRVSHVCTGSGYVGLIKRGKEVVWRCPHVHKNRDQDAAHTAARPCAALVLRALLEPERAREFIKKIQRAAPHFQHAWQAKEWAWTIQRHEWALATADEIRGTVFP